MCRNTGWLSKMSIVFVPIFEYRTKLALSWKFVRNSWVDYKWWRPDFRFIIEKSIPLNRSIEINYKIIVSVIIFHRIKLNQGFRADTHTHKNCISNYCPVKCEMIPQRQTIKTSHDASSSEIFHLSCSQIIFIFICFSLNDIRPLHHRFFLRKLCKHDVVSKNYSPPT